MTDARAPSRTMEPKISAHWGAVFLSIALPPHRYRSFNFLFSPPSFFQASRSFLVEKKQSAISSAEWPRRHFPHFPCWRTHPEARSSTVGVTKKSPIFEARRSENNFEPWVGCRGLLHFAFLSNLSARKHAQMLMLAERRVARKNLRKPDKPSWLCDS